MDFDPDKYLAQKGDKSQGASFNPDAYLAEKTKGERPDVIEQLSGVDPTNPDTSFATDKDRLTGAAALGLMGTAAMGAPGAAFGFIPNVAKGFGASLGVGGGFEVGKAIARRIMGFLAGSKH